MKLTITSLATSVAAVGAIGAAAIGFAALTPSEAGGAAAQVRLVAVGAPCRRTRPWPPAFRPPPS